MLTVQPSVNYQNSQHVAFKQAKVVEMNKDYSEQIYEEKVKYYQDKSNEFDRLSKNNDFPTTFKKAAKVFKVISQAAFEGWLVWWGTAKGAKFVKGLLTSKNGAKFVKTAKDILRPIKNGLQTSGKKIVDSYNGGIKNIKTSEFVQSMKKNSIGKYVVTGLKYLEKGFRFIAGKIKSGYDFVAKPFKNKSNSEIYDTTAKYSSVILGAGAGLAGAYNAATDAQARRAEFAKMKAQEQQAKEMPEDEE